MLKSASVMGCSEVYLGFAERSLAITLVFVVPAGSVPRGSEVI